MSDTGEVFNPEYNPNGAEGSLDTNKLPWIPLDNVKGLSIKPVRASSETGMFSLIFKLDKAQAFQVLFIGRNGFNGFVWPINLHPR